MGKIAKRNIKRGEPITYEDLLVNGNDLELINILDTNYKDEMLSWRNQEFVRKNMRNPEI